MHPKCIVPVTRHNAAMMIMLERALAEFEEILLPSLRFIMMLQAWQVVVLHCCQLSGF